MSGYDSDPFVKLRKKIFGEDKKKAVEDGGESTMKKGGKVKKYAEGDVIEDESDRGEVTPEQKQAGRDANTFSEAFKAAREAGEKTFEWNGKKYTTEMAKPQSFKDKAKKAGFSAAETKGGAALMTRKDRGFKAGGSVSASRRGDGIAQRGKTRGKMC